MFAPDSAYINPSERDPDYQEMEWSYSLAMSHAVVDSIAAELADALRKVRDRYYNQSGVRSGGAESPSSIGFAALERFDNLTKGTE